jgi:hypothetical protein
VTAAHADSTTRRLGDLAPRVTRMALGIGGIGLAVALLLLWLTDGVDARRFFRAYLTAFLFVLSVGLGGFFFTFVQHLTRAGWSVTVRRLAEAAAANLTWLWILFLPILGLVVFGKGDILFSWLDVAHQDDIIKGKAAYLNKTFWIVRAVLYFLIWAGFAAFFFRNSVAQDDSGDVALTHRMQRWAPIAAILYAVTQTFAIIDWGMSLEAHWFSTMYGVYFFAASACGFFATLILVVFFLQRRGRLESDITLEHYQDMGKLLFAFGVVFWAYIAFSQYMLIWYANIPEETNWYLTRRLGGWTGVSTLLLLGHFVIPFLLLVTKHTKRIKPVLAGIAVWMIVLHYVDVYWLVMPQVPAEQIAAATTLSELQSMIETDALDLGFHPHLVDLACVLGLGGFFVAGMARRLRACALVPTHDPRLHEALAFENM